MDADVPLTRTRDLTLIWGVGPAQAAAMEALGVTSYADLVDCDQVELLAGLRASKRSVSAAMVRGWCHHAQSYSRSEAVLFGSPPPLPSSFIALDLEYVSGGNTWLIGAYVVDGDDRRVSSCGPTVPQRSVAAFASWRSWSRSIPRCPC